MIYQNSRLISEEVIRQETFRSQRAEWLVDYVLSRLLPHDLLDIPILPDTDGYFSTIRRTGSRYLHIEGSNGSGETIDIKKWRIYVEDGISSDITPITNLPSNGKLLRDCIVHVQPTKRKLMIFLTKYNPETSV